MSLQEKIGVILCHAHGIQLLTQQRHLRYRIRIMVLKPSNLTLHPLLDSYDSTLRTAHINALEPDVNVKVLHAELIMLFLAVEPDVPDKQRIDRLGVEFHECREIYQTVVIQGALHTNLMQAARPALIVLYGVCICLYDERIGYYVT